MDRKSPKIIWVETKLPNDFPDNFTNLVKALLIEGQPVVLYLTQDAVIWIAQNQNHLTFFSHPLLNIVCDEFSLKLRNLDMFNLGPNIKKVYEHYLVDEMLQPNTKVIWH